MLLMSRRTGPPSLPTPTSMSPSLSSNRSAIVADDNVDVAVVVDIAKRRATPNLGQLEDGACQAGDILERAATEVSEQLFSLIVRKAAVRAPLEGDASIYGENIQQTIIVEVEPRGAKARVRKGRRPESRSVPQILERPRPVIDEQGGTLAREVREEKILISVVV